MVGTMIDDMKQDISDGIFILLALCILIYYCLVNIHFLNNLQRNFIVVHIGCTHGNECLRIPNSKLWCFRLDPAIPDMMCIENMAEELNRLFRNDIECIRNKSQYFHIHVMVVIKKVLKKRFHSLEILSSGIRFL